MKRIVVVPQWLSDAYPIIVDGKLSVNETLGGPGSEGKLPVSALSDMAELSSILSESDVNSYGVAQDCSSFLRETFNPLYPLFEDINKFQAAPSFNAGAYLKALRMGAGVNFLFDIANDGDTARLFYRAMISGPTNIALNNDPSIERNAAYGIEFSPEVIGDTMVVFARSLQPNGERTPARHREFYSKCIEMMSLSMNFDGVVNTQTFKSYLSATRLAA